jgi:hypothetical protein
MTIKTKPRKPGRLIALLLLFSGAIASPAQIKTTRNYPKEIRGYKVERTVVEVKKPETETRNSGNKGREPNSEPNAEADVDELIKLGKPQLARVTPLGITFEVPVIVSPVKQSGHVDFLVFEDMVVNGASVNIDEYQREFDLPNKQPLTLSEPLHFYIYLPSALIAALGDWSDSKETWPVTGRVYIFGRFKKSLLHFKRVVPVELNVTMRNPLKER